MRRALIWGAVGLLVLACAGITAREKVLIPAMALAWPGIVVDVTFGLDAEPDPVVRGQVEGEVALMGRALASGNREQVTAVDWPSLQAMAHAGITDRVAQGLIGPTVAESLRERVVVFNESWIKLGTR